MSKSPIAFLDLGSRGASSSTSEYQPKFMPPVPAGRLGCALAPVRTK